MHTLPLPKHLWWPWDQAVRSVGFWRAFFLPVPTTVQLYIASSGSYQAWLDGQPLAVPAGHLPSWRSMHRLGLELAAGQHVLWVEAESSAIQQPFWMACLDWLQDGQPQRIASDEQWRMAFNPIPGVYSAEDPSQPPPGMRPAWAFDGVWAEPWGMPCNAPDDFCRLTTGWQQMTARRLARIARVYPGAAGLGSALRVHSDGSLEAQPPLPYPVQLPTIASNERRLEWYRTREAHSLINNTWLDLFESRCPHIVFDVGEETFARLRLQLRSGGPAILAITTGESRNEVQRYARRVTDLVQLADGESFTTAPTGFRYAKVMVLSSGGEEVRLDPLELQEVLYPLDRSGQFRCSDSDLNAIFDLSARTLHLCMQNEIWDGIKRDQLPWMGDLYTEALGVYLLFGDYRLARRSLAVLGELGPAPQRPLEEQGYPGLQAIWRTKAGDINDIPSYTLWWMVGLWDYWQYSGDLSLIVDLAQEIQAVLEHVSRWVDASGFWHIQSGWDFVDWAPLSAEERGIYTHLLACRALRMGSALLEAAGLPGAHYTALAERMAQAARSAWGLSEKGERLGSTHHTLSQAICSGILPAGEAQALFDSYLRSDPPLSMTYWHRYLDLAASQQVGEIAWGLDYIRRHWGQGLQLGMTAFWEAFDPAWIGEDPHAVSMVGAGYARYGGYETSLCHGWSSGPAAWLLSAVLGITPAAPGFTRCRFHPDLGGLAWAEGAVPTPQGIIQVRLDAAGPNGKPKARLQVPDGVKIEVDDAVRAAWKIEEVPV